MKLRNLRKTFSDVNWESCLTGTVEEDWSLFRCIYNKAIEDCIPWKIIKTIKKPKWMTRGVS
jgi:hypothetical protein